MAEVQVRAGLWVEVRLEISGRLRASVSICTSVLTCTTGVVALLFQYRRFPSLFCGSAVLLSSLMTDLADLFPPPHARCASVLVFRWLRRSLRRAIIVVFTFLLVALTAFIIVSSPKKRRYKKKRERICPKKSARQKMQYLQSKKPYDTTARRQLRGHAVV